MIHWLSAGRRFASIRAIAACSLALSSICAVDSPVLAYLNGIDVYSGNGTINWTSVKNGGYDFAFVKATEGVNFYDSQFTNNMTNARAAGVYVGPYHFAHTESLSPAGTPNFNNYTGGAFAYDSPLQPNRDAWFDATMEAVDFIKRIRPYYQQTGNTHYLPPVSDIEQSAMPSPATQALKREFVTNWAELFAQTVHDALGVRPILYASKSSSTTNFTTTFGNKQPFWIAWYKGNGTVSPPVPSDTPGWPAWSFWQWSDGTDAIATGNPVPGAGAHIDRNVYSGTLAQLDGMTVQIVRGDYNHNNTVDAGDYVSWRKQMSLPAAKYNAYSVAFLGADGNLSNQVDAGDFTHWRSQFGKTLSGAGAGSGLDGSNGVPEPSSLVLFGCSILFAIGARRYRRATPGSAGGFRTTATAFEASRRIDPRQSRGLPTELRCIACNVAVSH